MLNLKNSIRSHLLEILLLALVIVIPLYPKLPLFDVAFTWTYIRLEDVLVGFSLFVFGLYFIFKQVRIKNFLLKPIVIFWIVGLVSTIWALATLGVRDNWAIYKPHLIVLHYFRRLEYLGVFFLSFAVISKTEWRGVKRMLGALIFGLIGVIAYGLGQKYLGLCSYLTMNEEFAKGKCIALQAGTRISSTFGGHYDLAGYLVLVLPIVASLFFVTKDVYKRIGIGVVLASGFFVMLLTSSRISFFALIVSFVFLALIIIPQKRIIAAGFVVITILTLVFGQNTIVDRFSKTLRFKDVIVERGTDKVMEIPTVDKDWGGLPESDRVILLPFFPSVATGSAYKVTKYEKGSVEDTQFSTASGNTRQAVNVPQAETKESASSDSREIIEEVRVVNGDFEKRKALIFDISFTTRIDGGWPNAMAGFWYNPILGRGYSTVTSAVDSSYVRALGEVGIVGFISFFSIFVIYLVKAFGYINSSSDQLGKMLVVGITCGVIGLLVNALLIDIFEASKVAYLLWILLGVAVWIIAKNKDTLKS
jgi:hypothetical protein